MESPAAAKSRIIFREVYVFDMKEVKAIFSQNIIKYCENKMLFGIPFLLSKKDNKITSFASLILNQNNEIIYKIYDDGSLIPEDKILFEEYISNFLKKKKSNNFNNPEQLKLSTRQIVHYLNF